MSHWQGKYVIGLTGNIATGKSVVRRMLEHLGAYGIDADALSHRAIARGAPGYQPVVDAFGKYILDPNGEINRGKLGRLVFTDPEAMKQLERIVHPLVTQAIDVMVRRSSQRVIVIEAIKILETSLAGYCDAIWTTYAPMDVQKVRLMQKRQMSAEDALLRIRAQGGQEAKTASAHVVIQNSGSFEHTWKQVQAAWKKIFPEAELEPRAVPHKTQVALSVERGRPRDSARIAEFMSHSKAGSGSMTTDDIMAAFGEKAFLLLFSGASLAGLIGWQVENLVARITDVMLDPAAPMPEAIKLLIAEVEAASRDLQCEAALLFIPGQLVISPITWKELGYEQRMPQSLDVQAWQEAANESMPAGTRLYFKQLRQDRILRPI